MLTRYTFTNGIESSFRNVAMMFSSVSRAVVIFFRGNSDYQIFFSDSYTYQFLLEF